MAAIKPATPLPWHLDERSICGWLDRGGAIKDVETTVAEVFTGEDRDAAYIVAACNNFPRLVEALRGMISDSEATYDACKKATHGAEISIGQFRRLNAARALLSELGEA